MIAAAPSPLPLAQPSTPGVVAVPQHEPLRVLLVEDDPFTLKILEKRVRGGGYTLATATDGKQGLALVESFQPQLIISDWMMPEMDGVEFCSNVRARAGGSSIYFILLTARDRNDDKVSAFETGADEYLVKPCDGRELMARLGAAERLLRLQSDLERSNTQLQGAYRRINEEMQATSLIQRSMLPQTLPVVPGYRFAAHYQPSTECSGDFYDMLVLDEHRLGIVIGDVSGHGAPAMVAMALCRMLVRMEAPHAESPAALMHILNNRLFEHLPTSQYATMFYGVLDIPSGKLVFSSAGHNPPLMIEGQSGRNQFLSGCEGYPIKLVAPDVAYELREVQIPAGQKLMFYTDGLVEAFNNEGACYGSERLGESAARCASEAPASLIRHILRDLDAYRGNHPFDDDLSLLIIERE